MKRKIRFTPLITLVSLLLFIAFVHPVSGQVESENTWVKINSARPAPPEINLLYSDIETSRVEVILHGFWKENIRNVDGVRELKISDNNTTPILIKGAPDLNKLTVSLIIPDRARMQVSLKEEEYIDFPGIHIIPSKGNLTRDIDPDDIPYEYGREYKTDAFFPVVAAELRAPHIIRDIRGQVVVIYPFRYNPVQKVLRVYTRMVVEIKAVGEDGENVRTAGREDDKTVRAFNGIYERNFLNFADYGSASRYIPLEEDGNMLIISYGSFMAGMQDFINWKNMSGIPTEIVNVSTVGSTAAAIKSYVANYYNTNGLTYLLLVGDAAQVPTSSTTAGPSDNDYGYIAGNDHYPDIFVGRFSAENTAHVQTQVQRTLDYEKEPDPVSGSFQRSMCIASDQGPGDDGEYDYQHQRNIRTDYMGYTYTYGAELYDGSQGGQDAAGNPSTTMVANEINTGIGVISYTGHGSNTSWGTTGFSNTNVISLTNNDKLPFIFSVACVNGNFVSYTCFAEAWLRATYNGQPSGAIATIMSTINQSWNPPMQGQDEMVDILAEIYPNNIKRTFGGICMNGCMNMNDVYGSAGADMTDTWTIFGDPSLMVRTAAPAAMAVTHAGNLPLGSSQITVYCDHEGARVAVSNDYQLLGTGIINGGSVDVVFGQINTDDILTITVTAFNCLPFIDTVIIGGTSEMAYVSCTAFHSNLGDVVPGEQDVEALGVKVIMSGSQNPLNLLSMTFNMNGTTSLSDVDGISVYYTGNSSAFGTSTLFGTAAVSAGSITITGSMELTGGFNFFWLAYDLSAAAGPGNELDAECTEVVLTGSTGAQIPDITDPDGYRMIGLEYCIPSYTYGTGDGDYISLVSLASLSKSSSGAPSPYYTYYQDVTTQLVQGNTCQLIVSPGTYGSGNNIAAWIDFDRDGTFETGEKLGELTVAPTPATGTITFLVPVTAFTGIVRMRVREVWSTTNIDPCAAYSYGETEDYDVHIMPPGCWLGLTNEWNNPANWSDGVVPGLNSHVIIPEILMGDYYPSVFSGENPVIDRLDMEDGSNLDIPVGVTITVGSGR
jgi:hypothetical protein